MSHATDKETKKQWPEGLHRGHPDLSTRDLTRAEQEEFGEPSGYLSNESGLERLSVSLGVMREHRDCYAAMYSLEYEDGTCHEFFPRLQPIVPHQFLAQNFLQKSTSCAVELPTASGC